VDALFAIDLALHFFLMYPELSSMSGERWVDDSRKIVRHYLTGWFTFDLLALVAGSFDMIALLAIADDSVDDLNSVRAVRVLLRLLRVARLLKMLRLLNFRRVIRKWEAFTGETVAVSYATFKLVECVVLVVTVSHWFACIWGLQSSFYSTRVDSWMGEFGYCSLIPAAGANASAGALISPADLEYATAECKAASTLYVAAFYVRTRLGASRIRFRTSPIRPRTSPIRPRTLAGRRPAASPRSRGPCPSGGP
jgi:hypothetical protein